MPVCKICKTEYQIKSNLCPYCGCYIKAPLQQKLFIAGIICMILAVIFIETILILLLFPAIISLAIAIILIIKDTIKINNIRKRNNIIIKDLLNNIKNECKKELTEIEQNHRAQLKQLVQEYKELTETEDETEDEINETD